MGFEVVLNQQFVERSKRFLDGEGLRDDVDAVVLVLDHFFESAHLTFDDAAAVKGPLFDVFDHEIEYIPSAWEYPQGVYGWRC